MKRFIFILIAIKLLSCDVGIDGTFTEYELINESSCSIEVKGYLDGEVLDSYYIEENTSIIKGFSSPDPASVVYPPPFEPAADSCVVIYCDTYRITHFPSDELVLEKVLPIKNLFRDDDYDIESEGDNVKYTFLFTEEDLQRAVNGQ